MQEELLKTLLMKQNNAGELAMTKATKLHG